MKLGCYRASDAVVARTRVSREEHLALVKLWFVGAADSGSRASPFGHPPRLTKTDAPLLDAGRTQEASFCGCKLILIQDTLGK